MQDATTAAAVGRSAAGFWLNARASLASIAQKMRNHARSVTR
jgi:hypothetical protein